MNTYQCKDDIINADEKGQLLSEVKNISLWSNNFLTMHLKMILVQV